MAKINMIINGSTVQVDEGKTILAAAKELGIDIPTLCAHPDIHVAGNCRVCIVEQKGARTLPTACTTPVREGLEINTNSIKVRNARRTIIELLLSEHNCNCTACYKNGNCELQNLAAQYKITSSQFINLINKKGYTIDNYSPSIVKDDSKCVRCQRCVRTCDELQKVGALTAAFKGEHMKISTFEELPMSEIVCTNCGQCVNRCPTAALTEKSDVDKVWDAIFDPDIHAVVQTAPAIRIGISESFGNEAGIRSTGKMVAGLKALGFNSVLDTDFTADLTIMEEGHELLTRLKKALVDKEDVALPMITSCSPGWIKFAEHRHSDLLANLSTCKSPQQMFGALAKTYYAQKRNLDPSKIVSISIMPCTAKKFEANRPEMKDSGYQDVDYVLTTRELAVMIEQAGIDFNALEDAQFDRIMGDSTGAAVIFGATGGVMEAALRTAYEVITGKEVPFENLNITAVRGMDGVKEASIKIEGCLPNWSFLEGVEVHVAIANGLSNADAVMKAVKNGEKQYHFIEIMACPGGCLGGGGQPIPTSPEIRKKRTEGIYLEDANMTLRKSHENPEILQIYKEFLGTPLGEKSHHLLHTRYIKREKY